MDKTKPDGVKTPSRHTLAARQRPVNVRKATEIGWSRAGTAEGEPPTHKGKMP